MVLEGDRKAFPLLPNYLASLACAQCKDFLLPTILLGVEVEVECSVTRATPPPTILPWPPSVHHLTPRGPSCSPSLAHSQQSGQPLGTTGTCCLLSCHGGSVMWTPGLSHQQASPETAFEPMAHGQKWHQLFSSSQPSTAVHNSSPRVLSLPRVQAVSTLTRIPKAASWGTSPTTFFTCSPSPPRRDSY